MAVEDKPSLIVLRSHIGWPSPHLTDTAKAHGDPFGPDEIRLTKEILGLPPDESFYVPDEVVELYRRCIPRGQAMRAEWQARFDAWSGDRTMWEACWAGRGVPGWETKLPSFEAGSQLATRRAINACLDASAEVVPGLVAGAADLTGNTGMLLEGTVQQRPDQPGGRQVYYGIREHAMGAVMTGMAAHGGVLPVGGTFFVFSDYMRPAVRLAALSRVHVIYSWTHDSVGSGRGRPDPSADRAAGGPAGHAGPRGPAAGRRQRDGRGVAGGGRRRGTHRPRAQSPVDPRARGGGRAGPGRAAPGRLRRSSTRRAGPPDVVLVGTGSEVHVCLEAGPAARGPGAPLAGSSRSRAGSSSSARSEEYRHSVLPPGVATLGVEAGASFGWDRYVDDSVSIDTFGASAPGEVALADFGFTPEHVAERAVALLGRSAAGSTDSPTTGR